MNYDPSNLDESLERIGLQEHARLLQEQGFDTWEQLLDITEDDLKDLGVKVGHRRRLQRAITDAKIAQQNDFTHVPGQQHHPQAGHNLSRDSRHQPSGSHDRITPAQSIVIPPTRRYRRHPKPDQNAPKKPPSGYVLFSNQIRDRIKDEGLDFSNIAKYVGDQWQDPPRPQDRTDCEQQAQTLKEAYYAELAEYKKTPDWQAYQLYLRDFRAKQDEKNAKEEKAATAQSDASASGSRPQTRRFVDGASPLTDPASLSEPALSTQSSRTDGYSFDESNVSTDTQTRWSTHSQPPLYHRSLSGHDNDSTRQATQHDSSTVRNHRWSSSTFPPRDGDGDFVILDAASNEYGEHSESQSPPISPLTTNAPGHRPLSSWHSHTNPSQPHHRDAEQETTYMPSPPPPPPPPISPIEQRNRLLPPPPRLGTAHFNVDPLHSSWGQQKPSSAPATWRERGAQEEFDLSLPPIRQAPGEGDGAQL